MLKNNRMYLRMGMIVSLAILFFAWIFFYIVPGRATVVFWIALITALTNASLLIILDKKSITSFLKSRIVHKAFLGVASLFIVLAILVGLFIISINFPMQFDMTQNKSYTVSKQTTDILSRIVEPLSIVVLRNKSSDPTSADWRADLLLKQYARLNKNVEVQYINPIEQPSVKAKYNMTQLGEIIFIYGNNKQVRIYRSDLAKPSSENSVLFVGEEKFTQAIYSLLEDKSHTVYFTVGHGERQIRDRGGEGLSYVRTFLENENYKTDELNIILEDIPTDASLIVIVSPIERFSDYEFRRLSNYVSIGGRILLLYDSVLDRRDFNSNLDKWLTEWGFSVRGDYVIDPVSSVIIPVNIVPQYTDHPITRALEEGNVFASLIIARSISTIPPKHKGTFKIIIETTPQGYGKVDPTFDLSRARFNPRTDLAGPISLAIEGSYPVEERDDLFGKIIMFGDATFSLNAYISPEEGRSVNVAFSGNKDLFMNSVAYLLDAREKITIRPKETNIRNLTITTTQANFIRYVAQIGLPGIFGIFGILIWFLRRRS